MIEDQKSQNPSTLTEDETTENPNSVTEDVTTEDVTTENPTSEDETTEMSTNAFSSPKLITMLTTNSRATLKATVRAIASTKTDRVTTTKIQSTAITEQPRYIFVF